MFRPRGGRGIIGHPLHAADKFGDRLDAVIVPGPALRVGEAETQVHAEDIGPVTQDVVVRRDRVAARLGHLLPVGAEDGALVDQGQEWFVKIEIAHVPQCFGDKPGVEQVHGGVFRAADVLVDRAHAVDLVAAERFPVILLST
jgi:hypothetical protein